MGQLKSLPDFDFEPVLGNHSEKRFGAFLKIAPRSARGEARQCTLECFLANES